MWIVAKIPPQMQSPEHILDLCLALSPQVSLCDDSVFVCLHGVSRYWNLPEFFEQLRTGEPADQGRASPLLAKLKDLNRRFKIDFTIAPRASWALWCDTHSPRSKMIHFFDDELFFESLKAARLSTLETLVDTNMRADFYKMADTLTDLGLSTAFALKEAALDKGQKSSFVERFGRVCDRLLKRLSGQADMPLRWYTPPRTIKDTFYPELEQMLSIEKTSDPLVRVREYLDQWEERLRIRKALLTGFDLMLVSSRKKVRYTLAVRLPKPSREAATLFKILEEKWHNSPDKPSSFFDDETDRITLTSHRIEDDHDRQMNLFDPHREEVEEKWNQLIGQLRSHEKTTAPVRIGAYAAKESFMPEHSIAWVEWDKDQKSVFVEDHPQRPTLLLSQPVPLDRLNFDTEAAFLNYVEKQNGLLSLERIRDPWNFEAPPQERAYARVQSHWMYWDDQQRRVYLHGYFE
jgi:hypothetical protein